MLERGSYEIGDRIRLRINVVDEVLHEADYRIVGTYEYFPTVYEEQAAIEAAEAGRDVVLLEKEASIGGRVLQLHHYFPKLCPPSCGMEINTRRLERSPRIRVLTRAEMTAAEDGKVTVSQAPAWVNEGCTACGKCSEVCPAKVEDPHNLGMSEVPAIRLPHPNAWPYRYTLDRKA